MTKGDASGHRTRRSFLIMEPFAATPDHVLFSEKRQPEWSFGQSAASLRGTRVGADVMLRQTSAPPLFSEYLRINCSIIVQSRAVWGLMPVVVSTILLTTAFRRKSAAVHFKSSLITSFPKRARVRGLGQADMDKVMSPRPLGWLWPTWGQTLAHLETNTAISQL